MFVSDYIGTNVKSHSMYEFVDVYLDGDNQIFIDPCLIEQSDDPWCKRAATQINVYFDCFFKKLRDKTILESGLLCHAGEQNATKLGYGNGSNGKGKTSTGLWNSVKELSKLVDDIQTINCAQDIPVMVEGLAEDCMSDWLTNILHELLNEFTCQQMLLWGCPPQGEKSIWTFDTVNKTWIQVVKPVWYYKGKELLLVPKQIVRKHFLFSTHQYLCSIIVDRIRAENGWEDLTKKDVLENLPRLSLHWEYDNVISYTREYPEALTAYHNEFPRFYRRKNGCMTDEALDKAIYGVVAKRVA